MHQERTQDDVARLLMERYGPQWFFWTEITPRLRMVGEKERSQKRAVRDPSPWLAAIRQRSAPGVSRYQPGILPGNVSRISLVAQDALTRRHGLGLSPRSPSGLFAETL